MPLRCRCVYCDGQFDSDKDDDICTRCDNERRRAMQQTALMPPPKLEDRLWSKAWMRERLGVNWREDV